MTLAVVRDAPLVSYAPNGEDIVLWRALGHLTPGWFVDVGANDPVFTSITRLFSERGWRGINVEPLPNFIEALERDRPHDVNVRAALSDQRGELSLFVVTDDLQRTTLSPVLADVYRNEGYEVVEVPTPVMTLNDVLGAHPLPRIDFLKIDAEGMEDPIVRGIDLVRHRPLVIVAEEGQHDAYEFPRLLAEAGYEELLWDGLNRFFVAAEAPERVRAALRYGANPSVDNFIRNEMAPAQRHIEQLNDHIDEIHASTTWRVGSAVLAPLNWMRGAVAARRSRRSRSE